MLTAIAIMLSLAFIGWISWQAAKRKQIKAHIAMYGLSCLTSIFTLAFFLTMDIPKIIKVVVCIILGAILIFLAAWQQRRRQRGQP